MLPDEIKANRRWVCRAMSGMEVRYMLTGTNENERHCWCVLPDQVKAELEYVVKDMAEAAL